jgi:hypothetical protein
MENGGSAQQVTALDQRESRPGGPVGRELDRLPSSRGPPSRNSIDVAEGGGLQSRCQVIGQCIAAGAAGAPPLEPDGASPWEPNGAKRAMAARSQHAG